MNVILAQTTVQEVFEAFQDRFWVLSGAIIWVVCWAVPVVALSYGIYFLISLPLRRQERARMLLDLVETGLRRGQSAERAVVAAAASGDTMLGARFHLLAAYIEDGMGLTEALVRVPRLLPPPVVAMLRVGVELGDLGRVLPACRKQLKDGLSQTRSGMNFVLVLVFIIMPVFPLVFFTISTWVVPRLEMIFKDMVEGGVPAACWSMPLAVRLMGIHAALVGLLQVLMICYVGGPRLKGWFNHSAWLGLWTDRLLWRFPWRRKRMKRDFAMMLALLLDAGVPEARALVLASGSTANRYFERRAEQAGRALSEGMALPEALAMLDDLGELRWRLGNAARSGRGFVPALGGWIDALDAKAFQEEQTAAQLLTTGLVLFNGAMVGLFTVGVFQMLTTLIQEASLW